MGLFSFIQSKIDEKNEKAAKREQGEKEFLVKLSDIIENASADGKAQLTEIQEHYGLDDKFYIKNIQNAAESLIKGYLSDNILTADEYNNFFKIYKSLSLEMDQAELNLLNQKYLVWQVQEKGVLPIADSAEISIPMKKAEVVHYVSEAALKKIKTKTERVNYSGPSFSLRICKGVRYRAGSFNMNKVTSNYVDTIDNGKFFITNQRIIFVGASKNFTYPINKIIRTEMSQIGLVIQKENTMNPQIVGLNEYELPLCIISNVINAQLE